MQGYGSSTRVAWPRPGRALKALLIGNFVVYVLQLIFVRSGATWIQELQLSPQAVIEEGKLWQIVTYMGLHLPDQPTHLLFNLLWLWLFGSRLEQWWGPRRFVLAYFTFGAAGALLTLGVGLLSVSTEPFISFLGPEFWVRPHLGSSGAVVGITVAWGLVFAKEVFHLLLLGPVTGKTIVLMVVGLELLFALSLNPISSTSHFGGIFAALILCRGLWRPSKWKQGIRNLRLRSKRKAIEKELRVIKGGKGPGNGKNGSGGHNGVWN